MKLMPTDNMKSPLIAFFTLMILVTISSTAYAEISLSSYDTVMKPNGRLLIMGNINGDIQSFKPVNLVISDPTGKILYSLDLDINNEDQFKFLVTPTTTVLKEGIYTAVASHEDLKEKAQLEFTVTSQSPVVFDEDLEAEVIPEFGTVSIVVLVVAIISVIAISKKSRFNIIPRY